MVGLDALALLVMGLSYFVAKKILSGSPHIVSFLAPSGGEVPSEVLAGASAAIVSVALLFHSACQLYSKRAALSVVSPMQLSAIRNIWEKTAEIYPDEEQFVAKTEKAPYHRFITTFGRTLGMSSRLAVMAASGIATAICMIAGAAYISVQTAAIFALVGALVAFFLARSNRIASRSSTTYRVSNVGARTEVGNVLKNRDLQDQRENVEAELYKIYEEGPGFIARVSDRDRLFQIYQSQFLLKLAAAAGVCLSLALVLIQEKGENGVLPHIAVVIGSILLMKQAFGFLGAAAGFLTRLNLQHTELTAYKNFLDKGVFPDTSALAADEEEG